MARGRSDGATAWSFAPQPHLPPKIPVFSGSGSSTLDYSSSSNSNSNSSFFTNWPSLSHQIEGRSSRPRHHRTPSTSFLPQTPDWIDDLLNDSPADVAPAHAKGLHRRSSSDSFAFLEAPSQHARITNSAEEEESVGKRLDFASKGLDTFNEEQLMSMFAGMRLLQDSHTAHHTMSFDHGFSNPQLLDDQRGRGFEQSRNDVKVHNALLSASGKGEPVSTTIWLVDPSLDSKQAKRSAQRSRVRKMEYISQLEMAKDFFEKQVSTLSSQVADMEHHRTILNGDNDSIKQRLTTLLQKKLFTDGKDNPYKQLNMLINGALYGLTGSKTCIKGLVLIF